MSRTIEEVTPPAPKDNTPPPGYRWKTDGTLEAIPGGPVDTKAGIEGEKAKASEESQKAQAKIVVDKIKQVIPMINNKSAGFGANLRKVKGTQAYNVDQLVQTIKSNLGFESLKAMKEQSKTGASGLGALSDAELQLLTSMVASLDTGQSPDQLKKQLLLVSKCSVKHLLKVLLVITSVHFSVVSNVTKSNVVKLLLNQVQSLLTLNLKLKFTS